MDKVTLKSLMKFTNDKQIHFVCDEIYAVTVQYSSDFVSVSEAVQGMGDSLNLDLIHIVYSLSKDMGLPGLRVGIAYSYNDMGLPGLRVGIAYSYNDMVVNAGRKMSSFGLASMLSDEKFVDEFLSESKKRLASRSELFVKGFEEVGKRCLDSNDGLFRWMGLRALLKEPTFEEEMRLWQMIIDDLKLNVLPGSSFHCHNPGWFRVCFANMDDESLSREYECLWRNGKKVPK